MTFSLRPLALGASAVTAGILIAACGSAGNPKTVAAGQTTPTSTSSSTPPTSSTPSTSGGGLSLARLGSLTNYSFVSTAGNDGYTFTVTGEVHGPTDWKTHSTSPDVTNYDVNGRGYSVALGQVIPGSPQTLDAETSYAKALIGYTHVTGIQITTGGVCDVAGVQGTTYQVKTPGADASLLVETATACVAKNTGALLSYSSGVPGGSAASAVHITGANTSFKITAVGDVAPIAAPQTTPATSAPNAPPASSATQAMPAGFPSQVPTPPGKVLSSATLSASKWYVQLTETDASALATYIKALQSNGFNVQNTTDTSAADISTLSDSQYQVLFGRSGRLGRLRAS
ncbi:MAG: hypothetical protein ACP5P1_02750 [Acidimicrobiales bacterium]